MRLIRSQVNLSLTLMVGMAQRITCIKDEVRKIFRVPLSDDEIAEIYSAYCDCALRAVSQPKRKPYRTPRYGRKRTEVSSSSHAVEIVYHDHEYDPRAATNSWTRHEAREESVVMLSLCGEYIEFCDDTSASKLFYISVIDPCLVWHLCRSHKGMCSFI